MRATKEGQFEVLYTSPCYAMHYGECHLLYVIEALSQMNVSAIRETALESRVNARCISIRTIVYLLTRTLLHCETMPGNAYQLFGSYMQGGVFKLTYAYAEDEFG